MVSGKKGYGTQPHHARRLRRTKKLIANTLLHSDETIQASMRKGVLKSTSKLDFARVVQRIANQSNVSALISFRGFGIVGQAKRKRLSKLLDQWRVAGIKKNTEALGEAHPAIEHEIGSETELLLEYYSKMYELTKAIK